MFVGGFSVTGTADSVMNSWFFEASVMNLCGRVHEEVVVVDDESVFGVSGYEYVG